MDELKVKTEYDRLIGLLDMASIPKQKKEVLLPVIDNLAFQRIKLDETRELMENAQVICKYDNGGGQSGIRENPVFKGYVTLWKAYIAGLEVYQSYLPKDMQEEIRQDGNDILTKVKRMKVV